MQNFDVYKNRRKILVETVKKNYPNKKGVIVLFAGFESKKYKFRQESSFYYLSGLEEPGVVMVIDLDGATMLYLPQYAESRSKWVSSLLYGANKEFLNSCGITDLQFLGKACKGYAITNDCGPQEYEALITVLKKHIDAKDAIFTLYANNYSEQRLLIDRLSCVVPDLKSSMLDVSSIVANMRRTKSKQEIELMYKSVDCTIVAQEAAASMIDQDIMECEVQAGIEFIFTQSGGTAAFPSIVASGANGTVLHYTANNNLLRKGDLLIVDIGAELDYYCADLTRTYPVSGTFTKRQKQVYEIVLETQEYIADLAKPGYWLNNKNEPDKSLQHLASNFIKKCGFEQYFTHGIGHFLGMDVHDVGDLAEPLKEGDVITIEPGIYIPEEKMGIRIEDDYWIIQDGNVCLSEELPKNPNQIEEMMAQDMSDDFGDEE